MQNGDWHVKTVSGARTVDPFVKPSTLSMHVACGCEVAACGGAIPKKGCKHHDELLAQVKLYGHQSKNCPAKEIYQNNLQLTLDW